MVIWLHGQIVIWLLVAGCWFPNANYATATANLFFIKIYPKIIYTITNLFRYISLNGFEKLRRKYQEGKVKDIHANS